MSNKLFNNLRKRMTLQYSLIFGFIILLIVLATYALTWWSLLEIEKQGLKDKVIHEAEEWVNSREAPVNDKELFSNTMLSYFVGPDHKTIVLDQLTVTPTGRLLMEKHSDWPSIKDENPKMIRCHDNNGQHFRYLVAVCEVKNNKQLVGYLYIFKNMEVYYLAGVDTLKILGLLFIVLFCLASFGSYYLAGKNIAPISQAYDQQKQFTADASHEMRTPLAVMKLAVQGIGSDEDSKLSSFTQDTLTMLEQEVDRLTRLTENLMTLARSDNNKISPQFSKIYLSDLCIRVYNQLQIIAAEKNITLKQHILPNLTILGDNENITRLLIILLDNAIKYSESNTDIVFSLASQKNTVQIKVLDQGAGINAADKEKIFERFYRVEKARSRSMGGLGLGLSLAKAIVEQHHGKIWVEDNKPKGSIFIVQLPIKL